jgi:hypothetical protein
MSACGLKSWPSVKIQDVERSERVWVLRHPYVSCLVIIKSDMLIVTLEAKNSVSRRSFVVFIESFPYVRDKG